MITIEFSFAWLFFIIMAVGFVCIVCGMGAFKGEWIVFGVLLIFVGDFACVIGSANYMSHPTNGYEIFGKCYSSPYASSYDSYECISPTPQDNPYEKQPLHPIKWIIGFIWESGKLATGAVKFKVT